MKIEVASVPEPSTWLMFATGFVGLGLARSKKAPAKPKRSS
jgi:hypothetical protein